MTENKRHGRRKLVKPKNHSKNMQNAGALLMAGGILLGVASPSLAVDPPVNPTGTTESYKSVVDAASNFLSQSYSNRVITADPNVKLKFEIPSVKTAAGPETVKKEEIKAAEAKDAEAAALAAKIAAETPKTPAPEASPVGSASATMPKAEKEDVNTDPITPSKLLASPLKSLVTSSPFGFRVSPITGSNGDFHRGQDFVAPCGTEVFAAAGGTVIFSEWHQYGGGNRIEIDHGNGLITTYNHLSVSKVKVGQKVSRGDSIALSGTTGASTGCHLHFEVEINKKVVDPMPWLEQ